MFFDLLAFVLARGEFVPNAPGCFEEFFVVSLLFIVVNIRVDELIATPCIDSEALELKSFVEQLLANLLLFLCL